MIVIPSMQRTLNIRRASKLFSYITKDWDFEENPVVIFVAESELQDYRNALWDSGLNGACLETVKDNIGISNIRQEIIDWASYRKVEKVFMIDDDVSFRPFNPKFSSLYAVDNIPKKAILEDCYRQVMAMTNPKYPFNGVLHSLGSMGNKYMFSNNKKNFHCYCVHVPTLMREEIAFNTLADEACAPRPLFMEDYYVQMKLRLRGYNVLTNHNYTRNDGGRSEGGCQSEGQRDFEKQERTSYAMKAVFPDYIDIKEYPPNGSWDYGRIDISINMKKLLQDSNLKMPNRDNLIKMMKDNGYDGPFHIYKEYK